VIERVLLNGVDLDLDDVFAEVTIRHGRGSVDDGPMASTANLRLVHVTRELVSGFSAGDPLDVLLAGDVPRFRGRITDAKDAEDGLSIIAVSSMSWLSRRMVGGSDWPEESWRDRLLRVFEDAGILLTWAEVGDSWAAGEGSWTAYGTAGRLTLDTHDAGPLIAARVSSTETLGGYLSGEFRDSEAAIAANLPDGTVLIQQLSARSSKAIHELDSDFVYFPPEWEQTDEVENSLVLEWDDGSGTGPTVSAENASSIARFEVRPNQVTTALANAIEAGTRASLRVTRRGFPRWNAAPIDVLRLEPAISIGTPVRLHDLPDWAPDSAYLGIVEGWEDHVAPDEDGGLAWTMRLALSDPQLSGGFGELWFTTTDSWATAPPATWSNPSTLD
jgi:hypothetical protein